MARKGMDGRQESRRGLVIDDVSLLRRVFEVRKLSGQSGSAEQRLGFEAGREIERRYLPQVLLDREEILAMPDVYGRSIKHRYVYAYADTRRRRKDLRRFRLRKTKMMGKDGNNEGVLYRVAYKRRVEGNPNARDEVQFKIAADDPASTSDIKAFHDLWGAGSAETECDRFYIAHTMSNGGECEIHWEMRRTPLHLAGFVRIEVEFRSKEDEKFARENKEHALPAYIGEDVTDENGRYKINSLITNGLPKKARKLMEDLYRKKRKG